MCIYNRLVSDLFASMYKNVYFLNQEEDINLPNTFSKEGWKGYVDGGAVKKITNKYQASYTFDYESDVKYKKVLSFTSFKCSAGLNLLNFIESVINADSKIFVKSNGLIVKDARKYLFEILEIKINDSVIDNKFIDVLKKYFHNLEKIDFLNCNIQNNCSFDNFNVSLFFKNCEISDLRSFNNCSANLSFRETKIDKISPTTIMSKELTITYISKDNYINFKELFLKCNFPKLESIDIKPSKYKYSFEDNFIYMPYSAPKIEELSIEGKIRNLDFLTKFKYLRKCNINSIQDDFSLYYTYVTDGIERQKILNRNHEEYEVSKILNPYKSDMYIISELEKNRIIRLSNFLSIINYTEDDLSLLTQDDFIFNLLNKCNGENVYKYYLCYYNKLYLEKSPALSYALMFEIPYYKIVLNKYLYQYQEKYQYMKDENKQIVRTNNFIYGPNGLPIIFKHMKKPIETVEQAQDFMKNKNIENYNFKKENYEKFINDLKSINGDCCIADFIDCTHENFDIIVSEKTFKNIENSGELRAVFFQYDKAKKRLDAIINKNNQCKRLIEKMIMDYYDSFSTIEKAYLYKHQDDFIINNFHFKDRNFEKIYSELVPFESEVYDSINQKTSCLYDKYYRFLKLTYKQFYIFENPAFIPVKKEYVKKLKL